jgi:hypothetical protein
VGFPVIEKRGSTEFLVGLGVVANPSHRSFDRA